MMEQTDWQAIVAARVADIDAEISNTEETRAAYIRDAKACTEDLNRLRREREQVAAFPNVGRRKQDAGGTDTHATIPLDATGETALDMDGEGEE